MFKIVQEINTETITRNNARINVQMELLQIIQHGIVFRNVLGELMQKVLTKLVFCFVQQIILLIEEPV